MGLISALGGVWVLEQPALSLMERHPRIVSLSKKVNATGLGTVFFEHASPVRYGEPNGG